MNNISKGQMFLDLYLQIAWSIASVYLDCDTPPLQAHHRVVKKPSKQFLSLGIRSHHNPRAPTLRSYEESCFSFFLFSAFFAILAAILSLSDLFPARAILRFLPT